MVVIDTTYTSMENEEILTLLHPEGPKLYADLALLSAVGLTLTLSLNYSLIWLWCPRALTLKSRKLSTLFGYKVGFPPK